MTSCAEAIEASKKTKGSCLSPPKRRLYDRPSNESESGCTATRGFLSHDRTNAYGEIIGRRRAKTSLECSVPSGFVQASGHSDYRLGRSQVLCAYGGVGECPNRRIWVLTIAFEYENTTYGTHARLASRLTMGRTRARYRTGWLGSSH